MEESVRIAALAYAAAHYPLADLVVVGGSVGAGERRPRSDIDLVVIGPAAMFPGDADEAAHTDPWQGELVEVLACTPEAFRRHLADDLSRFRPVSSVLLVEGVPVLDRGTTADLLTETRAALAAGPAVPLAELDGRRYSVTNGLDDLLDAEDPAEQALLAAQLVQRVAEFLLLANRRWIASGRHLLRRLRELDEPVADALGRALADHDVASLERLTLDALEPFGGRLLAGYRR